MRYSQEIKNQVLELVKQGKSPAKVAKQFKVKLPTVYSWTKGMTVENAPVAKKPAQTKVASSKPSPESKKKTVQVELLELEIKHLREKVAVLEKMI